MRAIIVAIVALTTLPLLPWFLPLLRRIRPGAAAVHAAIAALLLLAVAAAPEPWPYLAMFGAWIWALWFMLAALGAIRRSAAAWYAAHPVEAADLPPAAGPVLPDFRWHRGRTTVDTGGSVGQPVEFWLGSRWQVSHYQNGIPLHYRETHLAVLLPPGPAARRLLGRREDILAGRRRSVWRRLVCGPALDPPYRLAEAADGTVVLAWTIYPAAPLFDAAFAALAVWLRR